MQKITNIERLKLLDITRRLAFFRNFSDIELRQILELHSNLISYEKGELLIVEGNTDKFFFIVLSGSVDVSKDDENLPFATLKSGEFFGEIAFLTDTPRTANVIANDTVITLRMDRATLDKLHVKIREKFKDNVIEKLESTQVKVRPISVKDLQEIRDSFMSVYIP